MNRAHNSKYCRKQINRVVLGLRPVGIAQPALNDFHTHNKLPVCLHIIRLSVGVSERGQLNCELHRLGVRTSGRSLNIRRVPEHWDIGRTSGRSPNIKTMFEHQDLAWTSTPSVDEHWCHAWGIRTLVIVSGWCLSIRTLPGHYDGAWLWREHRNIIAEECLKHQDSNRTS